MGQLGRKDGLHQEGVALMLNNTSAKALMHGNQ